MVPVQRTTCFGCLVRYLDSMRSHRWRDFAHRPGFSRLADGRNPKHQQQTEARLAHGGPSELPGGASFCIKR